MTASGLRRFLFVLVLSPLAGGALQAQSLLTSRVRADNDAFDFWLPPWYRPDEEYTSGVQLSLAWSGKAWWHRWLRPVSPACANEDEKCATRTYALGQKIFAGSRHVGDDGPLPPGTRPQAGWLYFSEVQRIETASRVEETSLTLGVTGPPAQAALFQRIAHGYAAAYNRPVDWSRQLPFEPAFALRYERWQRAWARELGGGWGVRLDPHAGGSVGTVLTEGVAGVRARADLPAPTPATGAAVPARLEVSLFADAALHGVVRNEFLDGTFFRASEHVRSRPWVSELQAGLTLRWRQLGASYEVHRMGSEYVTRPGPHTWGSLAAEWRYRR